MILREIGLHKALGEGIVRAIVYKFWPSDYKRLYTPCTTISSFSDYRAIAWRITNQVYLYIVRKYLCDSATIATNLVAILIPLKIILYLCIRHTILLNIV